MHVTVQLPELLQISKDEGGYMQKLKLMIVDDEYLIRQYIRNCIDWERLGYTIVGELGTAQGALQLAEELKPDVVLTDISGWVWIITCSSPSTKKNWKTWHWRLKRVSYPSSHRMSCFGN